MDKKKTVLLILAGAFVLVLVLAGVLYDTLGAQWVPDSMLSTMPPVATASPTAPSTAPTTQPTGETKPTTQPTQGQLPLAPDFTVYDREGNPVKLSDFFGKPIVLNFWASWCGPCQSEMPDFQAKYQELGDQVQFLMVNMTSGRESMDSATAFLDSTDYTFPIYFDTQSDAAYAYEVYYLPTTYFINAEGYAVAMANFALTADLLQQGIDMIIGEDTNG